MAQNNKAAELILELDYANQVLKGIYDALGVVVEGPGAINALLLSELRNETCDWIISFHKGQVSPAQIKCDIRTMVKFLKENCLSDYTQDCYSVEQIIFRRPQHKLFNCLTFEELLSAIDLLNTEYSEKIIHLGLNGVDKLKPHNAQSVDLNLPSGQNIGNGSMEFHFHKTVPINPFINLYRAKWDNNTLKVNDYINEYFGSTTCIEAGDAAKKALIDVEENEEHCKWLILGNFHNEDDFEDTLDTIEGCLKPFCDYLCCNIELDKVMYIIFERPSNDECLFVLTPSEFIHTVESIQTNISNQFKQQSLNIPRLFD